MFARSFVFLAFVAVAFAASGKLYRDDLCINFISALGLPTPTDECVRSSSGASYIVVCTNRTTDSNWQYDSYESGDCSGTPIDTYTGINSTDCAPFLSEEYVTFDCSSASRVGYSLVMLVLAALVMLIAMQ